MQFQIRLAKLNDKTDLLSLYKSMIGLPGCTWTDEYPNDEILDWDIENKHLYCLFNENDNLIAAASICSYSDGGLNDVDCFTNVKKWAEFARVAVQRNMQKKGYAKLLLL